MIGLLCNSIISKFEFLVKCLIILFEYSFVELLNLEFILFYIYINV